MSSVALSVSQSVSLVSLLRKFSVLSEKIRRGNENLLSNGEGERVCVQKSQKHPPPPNNDGAYKYITREGRGGRMKRRHSSPTLGVSDA